MVWFNPLRGESPLILGGRIYTLCYDWHALAVMAHEAGDSVNLFDPDILATALAIGLSRHHPGFDRDRIFSVSPPIGEAVKAFNGAMTRCYFGHEKPDDSRAASTPSTASDESRLDQISKALGVAFGCGIRPDHFWAMTPYQSKVAVAAHSERTKDELEMLLAASWHTAVFGRIKTIPPLKSLMRNHHDPTAVNDDDDDEQIRAKAMMAAFMGATKVRSITSQPLTHPVDQSA